VTGGFRPAQLSDRKTFDSRHENLHAKIYTRKFTPPSEPVAGCDASYVLKSPPAANRTERGKLNSVENGPRRSAAWKNVSFEYRWASRNLERFQAYAAELFGLKPDVILASTTPAAAALRHLVVPPSLLARADEVIE
jgi:hypothetical protein